MTECDWNLLARFSQHGEHSAFVTLVKRHRSRVEATCTRILGSCSDADDVVQATFFQLARCAEQLARVAPARRSLAPWLTRVATNICHDIARSRTARRHHEREYVRRCASASGSLSMGQLAPLVAELIAELPQRLREPIVLCYVEGIEHARAAAQLGLTVGTLRRRIQTAKSLLRSRLAARGIPISMFLLHILIDNPAKGATAPPSPVPAAPTAADPPAPPKHLLPQVTQHPLASPFQRPAMNGQASWVVKVGAIVAAIGLIALLQGFLSADAPGFATANAAARAAPVEVHSTRAAPPHEVQRTALPVISGRMPGPEATEWLVPQIADSRPSIDIDTLLESAQHFTPVAETPGGDFVAPEVPDTEIWSGSGLRLTGSAAVARQLFDKAIDWAGTDTPPNEELHRVRTEAAALLGITDLERGKDPQ